MIAGGPSNDQILAAFVEFLFTHPLGWLILASLVLISCGAVRLFEVLWRAVRSIC